MRRILVVQRISQEIRRGEPVEVYRLVKDLKRRFPNTAEDEIRRTVDEEIVASRANALWERL